MKRVAIGSVFALIVVVLATAIAWLTLSNTLLLGLISKRLETAIGARISYQSPASVSRSLSPQIILTNLSVSTDDKHFQLHTTSLDVQINLAQLLFGELDIDHLWLGETRVEVAHRDDAQPFRLSSDSFALPIIPVLRDVRIAQMSYGREGEASTLPMFSIDELKIQPLFDTASLALSAQIKVADKPVDIQATLGVYKHGASAQLPVSITVVSEGIDISTKGMLDLSAPSPVIEITVQGRASGLKRFASITAGELDIPGEVSLSARLAGTFEQLAMEDLSVNWQDADASTATLRGRIANLSTVTGFDLALDAQLNKPGWLSPLLSSSMGPLQSVQCTAQLSGDYPRLAVQGFKFKARDSQQLAIELAGQVNIAMGTEGPALENMQLALDFSAPLTHAARALLFEAVPEFGAVKAQAVIRSTTGAPALENLLVTIKDARGIDVELKGRIARFPLNDDPNEGYALNVDMRAKATSLMADRLGMSLPLKGPLDVKFRIEGTTQALQLNQIVLSAGSKKALQAEATGRIAFGPWSRSDPIEDIDLKLRADSASTKLLGSLIGQSLPELGALSARGQVHTVAGHHRLDALHVYTTRTAPLQVSVQGSINRLGLIPDLALDEINLKLAVTADDASALNKVFALQEDIPNIGPVNVSATIAGSDRKLTVSDVILSAGQNDILLVKANGHLGSLSAVNHWRLQDADLRINLASSNSRALPEMLGYDFPELGPLMGQARLHDKYKQLALDAVKLWIGEADTPALQVSGSIGDVIGFHKISASVTLNIDKQALVKLVNNPKLVELEPLQGKLVLSDRDNSLGIDVMHVESTHRDLNLLVDGEFPDFSDLATLKFSGHMGASNLQLLGSLFDLDWEPVGPVQFDSEISKADNKEVSIKASLTAGKLAVNTDLLALFDSRPPRVRGTITAEQFFFPEYLKKTDQEENQPSAAEPVFSTTPIDFSLLKKADVDIAIDIRSFDKEKSVFESAKMKIALKGAELSISQAQLAYPVGKIDFDAQLTTSGTPRIHYQAYGEHLNPWRTLDMKKSGGKADFKADIDVDLELTASGVSEHELASSLDGEVYITIKNGKIRRSLLELVFVDLVGWTTSQMADEKYAAISCGVADFSIREGLISTNGFFLDTKSIMITGDGSIDLGKEKVDYVFLPRKKSRLIVSAEPVKVKGPLNDLSVSAIPWKSAVVDYGSMIFAPYVFVGMKAADFLMGEFKEEDKDTPCLKYEKKDRLKDNAPQPKENLPTPP